MCNLQDNDVKEQIVKEYIPLVKYIASRIMIGKNKYMEYEDLVSYGIIGLMDAISKFNPEKGMKFSSYASIRIKGAIIDQIRKNRPITKGAMDKLNRYNGAIEALQNKLLREPNILEIAKYLELSLEEVSQIENYINHISMVSLENIIFSDDEEVNLLGIIEDKNSPSPEGELEEKEKLEVLSDAIKLLKEKEQLILNLYYYEKLTLKEIGAILSVSESRVCQLHARSISNLREAMKKLHYIN
ncbi:FliA/WhiG family RNA polymerase sigma factor [Clostridium botulinum]|uniref:RNA polymerase sigma factor n=1 Tax=Clostridium aquiflavi TaxID=3073603 RepID=A0ABU1EJP6_9CLOT|nr:MULTISPECIES: FliA/WhiG family RNA polymerase sigma factor [unclassified Clostridium]MBN1037828.1 FliA/WhiG family RNA polymerase sigma factor [Clostridium botulinum]MBN1067087.1 FliA/WhiG family RNA polymerase sigma factor [Clostridium botulinum]MDR5588618.1 FliA/WhiG family RNA polymerase sigma factor [Clostridium sp. 5N-1]NFI93916.1 FliA/WhiG family RNA polymerase sigma factor [Clostridium botulinum]NFO90382.1 FliA/WhiG family RNA polymerase sigma factor [Clostridium botulinum]